MVDITGTKITNICDVYKYLECKYKKLKREHIYLIGLENKIVRIAKDISFNNKVENADFETTDLFSNLKKYNCDSFIFSHNHPNGYPLPSDMDIELTKYLIDKNKTENVRLIEHLVYSSVTFWPILKYSLRMEVKL